jgi:hypothetical protein
MSLLKNDVQFIIENRNKSKLKEKLEMSMSLNESSLNNSIVSNMSTNTIKKKYNIRDNLELNGLTKFQEFLEGFNETKNLLFLVDNSNNVWELVRRNDLAIHSLTSSDNLTSIIHKYKDRYEMGEKLLNIEIKDIDDGKSMGDLDISKVTDLNISHLLRDGLNDNV